jgi:hypothetical protein
MPQKVLQDWPQQRKFLKISTFCKQIFQDLLRKTWAISNPNKTFLVFLRE